VATNDLYVEDGKVKYGAMEDGYKDYLALMNDWYNKGYIDADFVSGANEQAAMLNNEIGVMFGSCGSGIGKMMSATTDEKFSVTGTKMPVINKGDRAMFGSYQNAATGLFGVITQDAKNKELCAKILDYGYSDEGIMLHNFGIEGESYELVDKEGYEGKYPQFTELITNNADGLSMAVSMSRYTNSHTEAPFVQKREYMEQYAQLPQQQAALERWMDNDASEHYMPPVTLTNEQYQDILTSEADIVTYRNEMINKFIMGQVSIDKFEEFRQGLKDRGIEKYIQYYQEAYDKYMTR
jgi:putative aldouronate transport system substrate-binding protein